MTPDNGGYAIVAYTCSVLVFALYVVSLVMRERKLRARLDALDDARR